MDHRRRGSATAPGSPTGRGSDSARGRGWSSATARGWSSARGSASVRRTGPASASSRGRGWANPTGSDRGSATGQGSVCRRVRIVRGIRRRRRGRIRLLLLLLLLLLLRLALALLRLLRTLLGGLAERLILVADVVLLFCPQRPRLAVGGDGVVPRLLVEVAIAEAYVRQREVGARITRCLGTRGRIQSRLQFGDRFGKEVSPGVGGAEVVVRKVVIERVEADSGPGPGGSGVEVARGVIGAHRRSESDVDAGADGEHPERDDQQHRQQQHAAPTRGQRLVLDAAFALESAPPPAHQAHQCTFSFGGTGSFCGTGLDALGGGSDRPDFDGPGARGVRGARGAAPHAGLPRCGRRAPGPRAAARMRRAPGSSTAARPRPPPAPRSPPPSGLRRRGTSAPFRECGAGSRPRAAMRRPSERPHRCARWRSASPAGSCRADTARDRVPAHRDPAARRNPGSGASARLLSCRSRRRHRHRCIGPPRPSTRVDHRGSAHRRRSRTPAADARDGRLATP